VWSPCFIWHLGGTVLQTYGGESRLTWVGYCVVRWARDWLDRIFRSWTEGMLDNHMCHLILSSRVYDFYVIVIFLTWTASMQ
jgi:hypothetical protein